MIYYFKVHLILLRSKVVDQQNLAWLLCNVNFSLLRFLVFFFLFYGLFLQTRMCPILTAAYKNGLAFFVYSVQRFINRSS